VDPVGGHGCIAGSYCLFPFYPVPFVKGDSYPELCAQRTDEGGGSLWYSRGKNGEGDENGGSPEEALRGVFLCFS
jgi:hypothetical protein